MKQNLALFDFDGTLTTRDTLFQFLRFCRGASALNTRLVLLAPMLFLAKLKIYRPQRAKEHLLTWAFGNMTEDQFQKLCDSFCHTQLGSMIRHEALEKMKWHIEQGDTVSIVSASPENWIRPWASQWEISVIATKLQLLQGNITGRISGLNCNGAEKVVRIKAAYNLTEYEKIFAYGDSAGDKDMLSIAHEKFYRRFN